MSIYISGIEMPSHGSITLTIRADGFVQQQKEKPDYEPPNIGEAIEVPSHGRLGDLDAFESIKYELPNGQKAFNRGLHGGVQYVQRLIMDAPTIIPESKEGE